MFKLYVYIKALYIIYSDELKKQNKLKEIIVQLDGIKKIKNKNVHPWEMIYKYAGFCCLKIGTKEYDIKANDYLDIAHKTIDNVDTGILKKIISEIEIQKQSLLDGKDIFEKSKLTYMYR